VTRALLGLLVALVAITLLLATWLPGIGGVGFGQTTACERPDDPVVFAFPYARWPHIADHVHDARRHYHRLLHIDRPDADAHRDESLRYVPSWGTLSDAAKRVIDPVDWRLSHDRDEYPPAMMREGGEGADVRYVVSSENRSAGAVMGNALARYCDGVHVRLVAVR
jgi:hypothetical protein